MLLKKFHSPPPEGVNNLLENPTRVSLSELVREYVANVFDVGCQGSKVSSRCLFSNFPFPVWMFSENGQPYPHFLFRAACPSLRSQSHRVDVLDSTKLGQKGTQQIQTVARHAVFCCFVFFKPRGSGTNSHYSTVLPLNKLVHIICI